MAPLLWRRRRRDYSCSLHSGRGRRGVQARRKAPEASGSMGLHLPQPYLDDEAEARGEREAGEPEERSELRARGRAKLPQLQSTLQGSGEQGKMEEREIGGALSAV